MRIGRALIFVLVVILGAIDVAGCEPPRPLMAPPATKQADSSDGGSSEVVDAGYPGDPGATHLSEPRCDPRPGGIGEWYTLGKLVDGRRIDGTATVLDDGDILVVGGWPATDVQQCGETPPDIANVAERYTMATGEWHLVAPLAVCRWYHTATKLNDGRVLIAGGLPPEHEPYPYTCPGNVPAEIYDPDADTWTPTAPMHYARWDAVAVLLADGRVLVIGGTGGGSTEIYDPKLDSWQEAAPAPVEIDQVDPGGALLLPDGQVLAVGYGILGTGPHWTYQTEIYDPAMDRWHDESPIPVPASGITDWKPSIIMQPLPSGRVMVALRVTCLSGCGLPTSRTDGVFQEIAYIEDPYTGAWSATPPLPSISYGPASVVLSDGRVLVAGGRVDPGGGSTLAASIFDEASDSWRRAADMPQPRESFLVLPFPGDDAFVLGGDQVCFRDGQDVGDYELPVDRFHLDPLSVPAP